MRSPLENAVEDRKTPFQDLLNVGREARMNLPGSAEGNWRWRATPNDLSRNVSLATGIDERLKALWLVSVCGSGSCIMILKSR